jgi:osmotically-inducible protein OsmY
MNRSKSYSPNYDEDTSHYKKAKYRGYAPDSDENFRVYSREKDDRYYDDSEDDDYYEASDYRNKGRKSQKYSGRSARVRAYDDEAYGRYDTFGSEDQRERTNYYGRGPKSYTRSDERIAEDVNVCLYEHPDIDATDIEVQVKNCEVTLSGSVASRAMKRMAEDCIEQIRGVSDVTNQLKVRSEFGDYDKSSAATTTNKQTGSKGGQGGTAGSAASGLGSGTGSTTPASKH